MNRIYLDHNATTPPSAAAIDRMGAILREEFGNPSSVHHFGQRAKAALDEARTQVAALLGADPSEIVFTGSGTEGDNIAIRGIAEALEVTGRKHIITTSIEHEAVLNTVKALARRGWRTTNDSSSIAISLSKISRSRAGLSLAGSKQPRMQALLRISGLRPFQ